MSPLPNIALVGKMGSGKTTIANALAQNYGYTRISWADAVRYVASLAYGTIEYDKIYSVTLKSGATENLTGRQVLQRVGTEAMRDSVDQDFWVRTLFNRLAQAPNSGPWVVDDSRFDNELLYCRYYGWLTVHVKINEADRLARINTLYKEVNQSILEHSSEQEIERALIDIAIWNTTPDVNKTVAALMETAANHVDQLLRAKK